MKSISRRNWVKGMTLATLGSVDFTDLKAANAPSIQWSADQDQLLQAWIGVIIPESSIPGAVSLGVPAYVKVMLRDCYEPVASTTLMKVLASSLLFAHQTPVYPVRFGKTIVPFLTLKPSQWKAKPLILSSR